MHGAPVVCESRVEEYTSELVLDRETASPHDRASKRARKLARLCGRLIKRSRMGVVEQSTIVLQQHVERACTQSIHQQRNRSWIHVMGMKLICARDADAPGDGSHRGRRARRRHQAAWDYQQISACVRPRTHADVILQLRAHPAAAVVRGAGALRARRPVQGKPGSRGRRVPAAAAGCSATPPLTMAFAPCFPSGSVAGSLYNDGSVVGSRLPGVPHAFRPSSPLPPPPGGH
jgi:hypothetical protein